MLFDRDEDRISYIERELRVGYSDSHVVPCIGDVTDVARLSSIFDEYRPEVIFHAAGHKHVALMEDNPGEALKSNVLGTRIVADLADKCGVRTFVLISTDKAVNPTSIVGVSKQLAESYIRALSEESATHFVITRFGNLLASSGSVVPIFQEQIHRGGPITVTDERMARFFISLKDASQLILQAAAMGHGGEVFVFDMGEPIRIVDLARDLIRVSGLTEDSIDIVFTGKRPGEKLFEELYLATETSLPTCHPKIRVAYLHPVDLSRIRQTIAEIGVHLDDRNDVVRQNVTAALSDFMGPVEHR